MSRRPIQAELVKLLEHERVNHAQEIARLNEGYREGVERRRQLHRLELEDERSGRIHAQRGLVPYVRALQLFHEWLLQRPEVAEMVAPKMQELGIWAIKLGYDPDQDLSLSVISPLGK